MRRDTHSHWEKGRHRARTGGQAGGAGLSERRHPDKRPGRGRWPGQEDAVLAASCGRLPSGLAGQETRPLRRASGALRPTAGPDVPPAASAGTAHSGSVSLSTRLGS